LSSEDNADSTLTTEKRVLYQTSYSEKEKGHMRTEQFDTNTTVLRGKVRRVWGRTDVFARLLIGERNYANALLAAPPQTLQAGDNLTLSGYLFHHQFEETVFRFLENAGAKSFLDNVPEADRPAWQAITFKRINTMMYANGATTCTDDGATSESNLDGIIAKQWQHADNTYLRIAAYDAFTIASNQKGNRGQMRRQPHYVTVVIKDGQVGGREIQLRSKSRVRITGTLQSLTYHQSLFAALARRGDPETTAMIERLPEPGATHDIVATQESVHVVVSRLVVFS